MGVRLVDLELRADATAPRQARRAIAPAVAEVGADTAGITLAVSEAVTSAVVHSRRRSADRIRLVAEREATQVVIAVEENGDGSGDPADATPSDLGMATIEQLADEVRFTRGEAGPKLVMCFRLHDPAG